MAVSSRFSKEGAGQLARLKTHDGALPMTLLTMPTADFPREVSFLPDGRTVAATLFDAGQVELVPVPAAK